MYTYLGGAGPFFLLNWSLTTEEVGTTAIDDVGDATELLAVVEMLMYELLPSLVIEHVSPPAKRSCDL